MSAGPALPARLDAPRLVLRVPEPADDAALLEAIEASRAHLRRWVGWPTPELDLPAFVARQGVRAREGRAGGRELLMLMQAREGGPVLGQAGIVRPNWELGKVELTYWVRTDALGRGYAAEAAWRFTELAFEDLGAERVEVQIASDNLASRGVPERMGFPLEGVLRRAWRQAGAWQDLAIYALTRPDWEARRDAGGLERRGRA